MESLHIDIETYSSVDISSGVYKYTESPDFEILLISYAFDQGFVRIVDLASGETIPEALHRALLNPDIKKKAHNATFERIAFKAMGYDIPTEQWHCSMVKAAYCGLPLDLEQLSKVLKLEEKGKLSTGKALIRYFCKPCSPTKVNKGRTRNFPSDDPEKWEEFKKYCVNDTEAEREVEDMLSVYSIPDGERKLYVLDQRINDAGIRIDLNLAKNAFVLDTTNSAALKAELKNITGIDNPNSPAQLKEWLSNAMEKEITTLAKDSIDSLIEDAGPGLPSDVLELRKKTSKTSVKKYASMLSSVCDDGRAHGLFQFYGANRTGRWAGRIIQLHNLPQNHIAELDTARKTVANGDEDLLRLLYDDISDVLSQLIRTAFVPAPGHLFTVADFSAIEARVIAWLADETWRMDVFRSHGKIYEASASLMFGVPIESVTKGSDLRAKGKIAELALGYQGALGAMVKMGGADMGLTEEEMSSIVKRWRKANPRIVQLWSDLQGCAVHAVKTGRPTRSIHKGLLFESDKKVLTIQLPSGRKLFYQNPRMTFKNGQESLKYEGINQETKQWGWVDTYGGKLAENLTQAMSRDILANAMMNAAHHNIVMHVHDEIIAEAPADAAQDSLKELIQIMETPVPWAPDLPLRADGFITSYYKKE